MNLPDQTSLKILVVDDEPSVLVSLQMLLTHLGHVVQTTDSGMAALEQLTKETFDLVLTDYFMPDMRGDELARHLKRRYPSLRIIMISAYADVVKADCLDRGLVDYVLSKPFDIPQLKEAMNQAMSPRPPTVPAA